MRHHPTHIAPDPSYSIAFASGPVFRRQFPPHPHQRRPQPRVHLSRTVSSIVLAKLEEKCLQFCPWLSRTVSTPLVAKSSANVSPNSTSTPTNRLGKNCRQILSPKSPTHSPNRFGNLFAKSFRRICDVISSPTSPNSSPNRFDNTRVELIATPVTSPRQNSRGIISPKSWRTSRTVSPLVLAKLEEKYLPLCQWLSRTVSTPFG